MWTGVHLSGRVIFYYVSRSPVRRTAHSALHVMLLSYYIGMCVFHERQRDICRRRAYSQGFAKAVHMSNDRQHFDLAYTTPCRLHIVSSTELVQQQKNLIFVLTPGVKRRSELDGRMCFGFLAKVSRGSALVHMI